MMTVFGCEAFKHNVWLVLLAVWVCGLGCWSVMALFARALSATGGQRLGWLFLSSVAAGSTIWCTHFVAMLAYRPDAPISFDPVLTILSSIVAAVGAGLGFALAILAGKRGAPTAGGALLGLSIAAMHYLGMLAYRVDGIVAWNIPLLGISVLLAVGFSVAALSAAVRSTTLADRILATGLLLLAVVGLHFTGMAAFSVSPLRLAGGYASPDSLMALALAIAGMSLLIVGAGIVSYTIDDETRASARAQLREMALHDPLTGLPNRENFRHRLERDLGAASRRGSPVALALVDVNGLKDVNDQYGQIAGDAVLRDLASRLALRLRPDEALARVGGDEFAIVSPAYRSREREDLTVRIADALGRPFEVEGREHPVSASAGMAIFPADAGDDETLINNAGLALLRAKADRAGQVCRYERSMDEGARTRRRLANDLRAAIARGELELFFQPQAGVHDGEIRGFEALARWRHPEFGLVPPSEFIAIAEENGLIDALGEWVLRSACAQAATWEPRRRVALNVSPMQLARGDLGRLVREVLRETGLAPERLELELTESAVVEDPQRSLTLLREIRSLGVTLALDDFGAGHSSLATLQKFPFDKIKLDRAFMGEVETSKEARAVVKAVVALGRGLGIPVLAEGIETAGQLERLREYGCEEAQGFYLGRPAPMAHWVAQGGLRVHARAAPSRADAA